MGYGGRQDLRILKQPSQWRRTAFGSTTMRPTAAFSLWLTVAYLCTRCSHGFVWSPGRIPRRLSLSSPKVAAPLPSAANISQRDFVRLLASSSDTDQKSGSIWERFASLFSQSVAEKIPFSEIASDGNRKRVQLATLIRVGIPSVLAGIVATYLFPLFALSLATLMNDAGVFAVLSQDSSQFVQNFLTVSGLLFSILVGQTYYFMYQQQEAVYYALFNEVTEAKSLLEQVALVCQGRAMYSQVLKSISQYVRDDLKKLQDDPAVLLSARPVDDPLESIMYMTSVGVPSSVYETVRSLRQARAGRLGALQRKLPPVHLLLLWILAAIELISFPLLGAGTQTIGGYNILTVEGCLFGITTFGIVMTLRVVGELWRPAGGAYNVDRVLSVMVSGLEEELKARMSGNAIYAARDKSPSLPSAERYRIPEHAKKLEGEVAGLNSTWTEEPPALPVLKQGADAGLLVRLTRRLAKWVMRRRV